MHRLRILMLTCALAVALPHADAVARGARTVVHAGSILHSRAIQKSGLSMAKASPDARFGKGAYFALSRKGALRERPGATAIYRGRLTRQAWSRRLDTRRMSTIQLKRYTGTTDMRGAAKRGVIGPKLGKKIGERAAAEGRVVLYRGRGTTRAWANAFVPADLYQKGAVTRLRATPTRSLK